MKRENHTSSFSQKRVNVFAIVHGNAVVVGILKFSCSGSTETVLGEAAYPMDQVKSVEVVLVTGVDSGDPSYYSKYSVDDKTISKSAKHRGGAASYGTTITITV